MTGRGQLLDELDRIAANCCRFLELVRPEQQDWRLRDGMRSLIELANHLAQIPSVDLRIIKGDSEQQIQDYEQELKRDNGRALCGVMREGVRDVRRFMEGLSFDDYENGSATAFFGRTQTHSQWLLETITHIYHHRAMLFIYLKLNGHRIGTRELYS